MIPQIKKSIKKFLLSEKGEVNKKILSVGAILALNAISVMAGSVSCADHGNYTGNLDSATLTDSCHSSWHDSWQAICNPDGHDNVSAGDPCSTDKVLDHTNSVSLIKNAEESQITATHSHDLTLCSETNIDRTVRCSKYCDDASWGGFKHGSCTGDPD
jgi:hypothetical protein